MAQNNVLLAGLQQQIRFVQSLSNLLIKPPIDNVIGQVFSLLNVLGTASRKKVVDNHDKAFKPIAIPIHLEAPPVETVKGIGPKLAAKLRTAGIKTTDDLKNCNSLALKIPGISPNRIQKWQIIL